MKNEFVIKSLKLVFSSITIFLNCHITIAQNFIVSSVGVIKGTSSNATSVNFASNVNCINVQSGIAVLSGIRNAGEFAINCNITQEFNKLGIKIYPNPTVSTSTIKFVNTPPLNDEFMVRIFSASGANLISRKETGYQLFQGIVLDLQSLVSGSYIIRVESTHFNDAIMFIKAN
jgi:hypothetical protein